MEIKGKIAIVTGASAGIGRATAELLTKNGARVTLVARSKDKLEELSKKLPDSFVVSADMTKEDEIKEMVKKVAAHYGRVDILINNAGRGYDALVEKTDPKIFQEIFALDVVGPLVAMQQVIPIMRRQKEGTIINISSGTALMTLPDNGAYSSLKGALAAISLTAREELKETGISVSVVYPYVTLTDFEKNTIKENGEAGQEMDYSRLPHPPDTAEYVAQRIVDGIKTGEAEIFAHDWMKSLS